MINEMRAITIGIADFKKDMKIFYHQPTFQYTDKRHFYTKTIEQKWLKKYKKINNYHTQIINRMNEWMNE